MTKLRIYKRGSNDSTIFNILFIPRSYLYTKNNLSNTQIHTLTHIFFFLTVLKIFQNIPKFDDIFFSLIKKLTLLQKFIYV